MSYLDGVYKDVQKVQEEIHEERTERKEHAGTVSAELEEGDLVMMRLPPTVKRTGPKRFEPRVRPQFWRIKKKISPGTFRLENADSGFGHPKIHSAENLIKVNLPTLGVEQSRHLRLEIFNGETGEWSKYQIVDFDVEGKSVLQPITQTDGGYEFTGGRVMYDLTRHQYRWIS